MSGEFAEAVHSIVTRAMQRQNIPGLSIAVAREGEVLVARGFGGRNVGEQLAADANTIYSIASVSKQWTAAAIMQLTERGLLRLDETLDRYFPWVPNGGTIELRHLLSHTSGIPDYFPLADLDLIGFTDASPREIAESVLKNGPAFAPGAEYQYCNTGYVLLGAILEKVSGVSYADYVQAELLDPLGLSRTGVDDTPAIRNNVAVGYTSFALGPWELARDYHPAWEFATGGLYSTVADMLEWNAALRGGRVVSAASFARMTTAAELLTGHQIKYGFGLALSEVDGCREVRHTGGLPGMSTDNTTYPELGLDIIVFANHDGCSTYATITRPILALLTGRPELRASRTSDFAVSSGLNERPQAHAWIRAAAAGAIDDLPITPKFRRFLNRDRRARLGELSQLGAVGAITLTDAARRHPETTFAYRVDFEQGPLVANLAIRDDGTLANLQFTRWDDRA